MRSFGLKSGLAAIATLALSLTGCVIMAPGHLYPVQGPLSQQTPPPILNMSLSGAFTSGTVTATLADSTPVQGPWTAIRQNDPSARAMQDDWDAVYGTGFFVANVLGSPVFARAQLTGKGGRTLAAQFYDPRPGDVRAVKGIARDDAGNLYKLTL